MKIFPLDTTKSESNPQIKVTNFRSSFNDVSHLSPLGFYDSDGLDVTDIIYKTPRRVNICFFKVKFDLPLATLGFSFMMDQRCEMKYFLYLPQLLPGGAHTVAAESPVVSTHPFSSERRNLLSATTNSHSKFLSTPGRVVTNPGMSNFPSIVYVLGNSTTSNDVASACVTPVSGTNILMMLELAELVKMVMERSEMLPTLKLLATMPVTHECRRGTTVVLMM